MHTTRMFALASLVPSTFLLAVACDGPEIGEVDEVEFRPGGFNCSVCGGGLGNSPVVNGSALHEFSLDGTLNVDGLRILGAEFPGGKRFDVVVDPVSEQWVGLAASGSPKFVGAELVGARLVLETPGGDVSLELTAFDDQVPTWSNSGATVTAYKALYKDAQGQQASLCPSQLLDEQWFTLIAGETYDRANNRVDPNRGAWVTIACVGEGAMKLKMLGYHPAGGHSSADERQATLRMITADYCGTGQSFTASGVHVAWRDGKGTVEPPFAEDALEAHWGPNGALCLDTPRLAARADVDDSCAIPMCDDVDVVDSAVWRTMLP